MAKRRGKKFENKCPKCEGTDLEFENLAIDNVDGERNIVAEIQCNECGLKDRIVFFDMKYYSGLF